MNATKALNLVGLFNDELNNNLVKWADKNQTS